MANAGHFIDRNPDLRVAGQPSRDDKSRVDSCLRYGTTEELAQHWLLSDCKHKLMADKSPLLKRTPCHYEDNLKQLLATDLAKSRFVAFKEKFSEAMYFKQANVGAAKATNSKPDDVTNWSRTFGMKLAQNDPLYQIVLPPKSEEQVNREYANFHDKYILSHSHYFPAEQINRRYKQPFNRTSTFGVQYNADDTGKFAKRCMQDCDQLIIVSRPQMDFIDRTYGPLGSKYKKYPYDVPNDMVHGVPTKTAECDCKMLLENIDPCVSDNRLTDSIAHLNKMRRKIHESDDLHIYDLIAELEKHDRDNTRYLPLEKIFETMHKLHIRIDDEKIRNAVAHFGMIIDPHEPTERINYEDFCRLLMVQLPLPKTGNISNMPANVYNKETTYRLFCDDLRKPRTEAPLRHAKLRTIDRLDQEETHVCDLISPSIPTLYGLGPSEFDLLRPKDKMELIFVQLINAQNFEKLWQEGIEKYPEQNNCITVNQFRELIYNNNIETT